MIVVERLSKAYGAVQAVRDLSFTVSSGEVVGLIGPNGPARPHAEVHCRHPAPSAGSVASAGTTSSSARSRPSACWPSCRTNRSSSSTSRCGSTSISWPGCTASRPGRPRRRAPRRARADRQGEGAARRALPRDEAETGDCLRAAARSHGAAVRRAADGPRPARHPADEADHRLPRARRGGHRRVLAPAPSGRGDLHAHRDHQQGRQDRRRTLEELAARADLASGDPDLEQIFLHATGHGASDEAP